MQTFMIPGFLADKRDIVISLIIGNHAYRIAFIGLLWH